jgi:hypothetical protein
MSVSIPFEQSDNNYTLVVPVDDIPVQFFVRWNSRDRAFYFDMYEDDGSIIALNVKVVTGVPLARRSLHEFFKDRIMTAVDTTGSGTDPNYDELGTRVIVVIQSPEDWLP